MLHVNSATSWMLGVALTASFTATANAAFINYGDFGPDAPGVTEYKSVTESSGTDAVPLFDVPMIHHDTLDFDPKAFVASATNGAADITDGQLNYTMMTLPGTGAVSIEIAESGDFSLLGVGDAATLVAAGVSIDIDILEVDGVALVDPISFYASSSMIVDMVSSGQVLLNPWNNSLVVDLAAVLAANEIEFDLGVTLAEIVIDNSLQAISQTGTTAYIAKKDFTVTTIVTPEPASMALMSMGLLCVLRRR